MVDSQENVKGDDAQEELELALAPLRERLMTHPIYGCLRDERTVCLFMKAHVFAVWDFQSLLKALQGLVTCVDALYDQRVRLIVSADGEPDELYPEGDTAFLFERTASRLMEMRSQDYARR